MKATDKEIIKAARRLSREQELRDHNSLISFRNTVTANRAKYRRCREKQLLSRLYDDM